jgi:hypothetical protein
MLGNQVLHESAENQCTGPAYDLSISIVLEVFAYKESNNLLKNVRLEQVNTALHDLGAQGLYVISLESS